MKLTVAHRGVLRRWRDAVVPLHSWRPHTQGKGSIMPRKAISKKLRFDVFKRDGFVCQYCGATPNDAPLQIDHITPVAEGGTNDIDNLVTACQPCNIGKGATPLDNIPQSLEARAEETREREAQIAGYAAVMEQQRERLEDDMWRVAEAIHAGASNGYARDKLASIKRFVEALGVHDVLDSVDICDAKGKFSEHARWKYFCGVCWGKIRDRGEQQ